MSLSRTVRVTRGGGHTEERCRWGECTELSVAGRTVCGRQQPTHTYTLAHLRVWMVHTGILAQVSVGVGLGTRRPMGHVAWAAPSLTAPPREKYSVRGSGEVGWLTRCRDWVQGGEAAINVFCHRRLDTAKHAPTHTLSQPLSRSTRSQQQRRTLLLLWVCGSWWCITITDNVKGNESVICFRIKVSSATLFFFFLFLCAFDLKDGVICVCVLTLMCLSCRVGMR